MGGLEQENGSLVKQNKRLFGTVTSLPWPGQSMGMVQERKHCERRWTRGGGDRSEFSIMGAGPGGYAHVASFIGLGVGAHHHRRQTPCLLWDLEKILVGSA